MLIPISLSDVLCVMYLNCVLISAVFVCLKVEFALGLDLEIYGLGLGFQGRRYGLGLGLKILSLTISLNFRNFNLCIGFAQNLQSTPITNIFQSRANSTLFDL